MDSFRIVFSLVPATLLHLGGANTNSTLFLIRLVKDILNVAIDYLNYCYFQLPPILQLDPQRLVTKRENRGMPQFRQNPFRSNVIIPMLNQESSHSARPLLAPVIQTIPGGNSMARKRDFLESG